jgi:isonocardicin synthase
VAALAVQLVRLPAPELAVLRLGEELYAARARRGRPFGVRAADVLGELDGYRFVPHYPDLRASRAEAAVRPLREQGAAELGARLSAGGTGAELAAPFPPMTIEGAPVVVGASAWTTGYDELDQGERHIRGEVVRHLDALAAGATVLDPACSTGACLEAIVKSRDDVTAVGIDASPVMIERARQRAPLDAATLRLGDARRPLGLRVALCVCRCLQHQVVTRADADAILDACVAALEPEGTLVVTGFTPLYHLREDFEARGLDVRQTVAFDEDSGMLFPFYRAIAAGRSHS